MVRALELARTPGVPLGPNPRVGCVLLDPDGTTVAEGRHRGAGTPHAEAGALRLAREAGTPLEDTTMVVTLEPCNHTGRTGPCSRAILDAGIPRVIYAVADGTDLAARKLARVLSNDPAMGVLRHVDAGYARAYEVAAANGLRVPMREGGA